MQDEQKTHFINVTQTARLTLSFKEAAALLGVSVGLLRLEVARGLLRTVPIGRRVVLTMAELQRYLSPDTLDERSPMLDRGDQISTSQPKRKGARASQQR
jgi:excisionase family DNA binding protein